MRNAVGVLVYLRPGTNDADIAQVHFLGQLNNVADTLVRGRSSNFTDGKYLITFFQITFRNHLACRVHVAETCSL